jgi:hypothetical protein
MENKYLKKYLKYKEKYLQLQNQIGGTQRSNVLKEIIEEANLRYGGMENIPPSYLGGNMLLNRLNELSLLRKVPMSVYTILGHGCDLNKDEDIVPENCYYVHKAQCGLETYSIGWNPDGIRGWDNFFCLFSDHDERLYNPIAYADQLKNLNMNFTINKPGDNYVNNRFTPFYLSDQKSGLYKISDIKSEIDEEGFCLPEFVNGESTVIPIYPENIRDGEKLSGFKMCGILISWYKNSLLPTQEDINTLIEHFGLVDRFDKILNDSTKRFFWETKIECIKIFESLIIKHFKFDIKTLFNFYPGTYYSMSCRVPCLGIDTQDSFYPLRRQKSLENSDTF